MEKALEKPILIIVP